MSSGVPRVFLDTEVFIHANFNYKSPRFKSLMAQASAGRTKVFLTDLTLREIEANIRRLVDAAAASMKPPKVLKNSDQPHVRALFKELDAASIQKELCGQLEKYLKVVKATILKVPPAVLPLVLDAYFKKQPPFGLNKNKAEFPDALVLQTLREWCAKNDSDIAVVSQDKGVKATCDGDDTLHQFDDIAKYLDALFASDEALSSFVREMIPEARVPIVEKAKEIFPNRGVILVDQDGDVEDISLIDVVFHEMNIISLAPGKAVVELAVSMTFLADLSYKKPGTGTWDSEDQVLIFQDEVHESVQREMEDTIWVDVAFTRLDHKSFQVKQVWLDDNHDIEVESDFDL